MYPEDVPEEHLKQAIKERNYYKWLAENPNASEGLKKNAKLQFELCDTFTVPVPEDPHNYEECSMENFKKWQRNHCF